jgi:hypothetical protein
VVVIDLEDAAAIMVPKALTAMTWTQVRAPAFSTIAIAFALQLPMIGALHAG